ncbi:hypothetical protein OZX57_01495 [Bifidobacterium sp. ESL0682]|uniref:hypothetical protein n=1 Tax=Bifidobacterium sp. ESL0682 TaxID=2983212 RepID=UPI0023F78A8E|nr:hypothetical protein [Bifidobacterium sp. ESL0682]WEV42198.1 hypothetical protein OZX57_01495 [Bifidobacterium sp. ESL0682]
MHWVRQQVPDHATPLFIVAAVCAVLTVLSASIFAISANESVKRKREARREKREAAKAEEISISEAMTGSFAVLRTSIVHTTHNHRASHKKVAPVDTPAAPVGMSDDGNALASASNGLAGADNGDGFDDETSADDVSTPSIIDPTRRNLVADMQMRSDDDKSAETLPSDESGNGVGRHRGASEQESESDANQEGKVGRHSRFAPEADGQAAASVQAPVAVSLDESSRSSDDAGETNKDGEGRRTSSADAVIDEGHAEDETSVISLDELRAYYARFSQEDDEKDETPSQDAEHEKADANTDETDDNETVVKQAKKTEETGQQVDDDGDKPQANEDDHKAEEDA